MRFRALLPIFCASGILCAAPRQAVSVITTQHQDFAAGGVIRITGSTGELNVEGWDRPEVQIQVTRTVYRDETPADRDRARKELEGVHVTVDTSKASELAISTAFPKHKFPMSLAAKCEVDLDYRIMVPRNSKLEIQHGMGDVTIYDVSGDLQVRIRSGDIVAQLPQPGIYNIDARATLCMVYAATGGVWRAPYFIGQQFAGTTTGAARQINFRSGAGGISIVKM